ncbi:MAG: YciI family protein [Acetobacteraceae bacterium]|nr:YciI family protein [Acetobacteraceae bacterium]
MKYALFIYENESVYGPNRDNEAMTAIIGRHMAFSQGLGATMLHGAGLKGTNTATTVRIAGARQTLHDGPFAETKEQLGGFYVIEAPDLDAALAIARQVPIAADGCVEVRPLMCAD